MITADTVSTICNAIAHGGILTQILQQPNMPNMPQWHAYLASHPHDQARYKMARECYAATLVDQAHELRAKVLAGEVPPNAAKVVLKSLEWQASKEYSRIYGDKLQVEQTDTRPKLTDAEIKAKLADLLAKNGITPKDQIQPVDAEYKLLPKSLDSAANDNSGLHCKANATGKS